MSTLGTQNARAARDTLAALLGLGLPYPLRDLELDFASDVAHGRRADIRIRAAQAGLIYQLCTDEGEPLKGEHNQPLTAELSASQGIESATLESALFISGDVRDPRALLNELTAAATGVGALLRIRFKKETLDLLDAAPAGMTNDAARSAVIQDLSEILRQDSLYDEAAFRDVCLSPWTRELLLKAEPAPADVTRLNRFLLEDAFPLAIWRALALPTPPIDEDVTFTILASRKKQGVLVESWLTARASIKAGIATSLPVSFSPDGAAEIVIDYGASPAVAIEQSQEGISYQLLSAENSEIALSEAQVGNRGTVTLPVNVPLREDTGIKVKAFRTSAPGTFAFLKTDLKVKVAPNPKVILQVESVISDYRGSILLKLADFQATAQYTVYGRPVLPGEYVGAEAGARETVSALVPREPASEPQWFGFTGAPVEVDGAPQFTISVVVPDLKNGIEIPAEFIEIGDFKTVKGTLQSKTGPLEQDTLFIVRARKKNDERLGLVLDSKVLVLVRPLAPSLKVGDSPVVTSTPGFVIVTGTQKGVRYRLLRATDGTPVLNPGYHYDDRGIETTRLETDFVIDERGDQPVSLPTDALDKPTKFRVVAIRNFTALTAPLAESATIMVEPGGSN